MSGEKKHAIAELYQNCHKSDYLNKGSKKNLFKFKVCDHYFKYIQSILSE